MKIDFHWHDYNYFPYEKDLANREIESLFRRKTIEIAGGLRIENVNRIWAPLASRITYFHNISATSGKQVIPLQTLLETSSNGGVQLSLTGKTIVPPLRRQSTRYSAHGIHEYRGKFNPQIVRAAGNIIGIKPNDWIIDPFCGSGTTLLEAVHNNWNAIGVDANPLAVMIAKAKLASMHMLADELVKQHLNLEKQLKERIRGLDFNKTWSRNEIENFTGKDIENRLPDSEYIHAWFNDSIIAQIIVIMDEIKQISDENAQLIFMMVLSDILREVSLQDPGDLRIRRRKNPLMNSPVIEEYLSRLSDQIDRIVKARKFLSRASTSQDALLGDTRKLSELFNKEHRRRFDGAITSPPYVTALPYIDTQRLSLILLGLVKSDDISKTERSLIGNREIRDKERRQIEEAILNNMDNLPEYCISLCRNLVNSVDSETDGFRKRNMPALTYQYCRDMLFSFKEMKKILKPHAPYVIVVGRNKTVLGGKEIIIDAPAILASVATSAGFMPENRIELNTYQRYDLHQSNSIRSETMLILRMPSNEGRSNPSGEHCGPAIQANRRHTQ